MKYEIEYTVRYRSCINLSEKNALTLDDEVSASANGLSELEMSELEIPDGKTSEYVIDSLSVKKITPISETISAADLVEKIAIELIKNTNNNMKMGRVLFIQRIANEVFHDKIISISADGYRFEERKRRN